MRKITYQFQGPTSETARDITGECHHRYARAADLARELGVFEAARRPSTPYRTVNPQQGIKEGALGHAPEA